MGVVGHRLGLAQYGPGEAYRSGAVGGWAGGGGGTASVAGAAAATAAVTGNTAGGMGAGKDTLASLAAKGALVVPHRLSV
ncbi:hypothetical protein EST92_13345 [Streptomyces sp. TM32]|nr:hypothetical protein EST92_13345 [Streptomyces sp. TM32]